MRVLLLTVVVMVLAFTAFLAPAMEFADVHSVPITDAIEVTYRRAVFWAFVTVVLTAGALVLAKFGGFIIDGLALPLVVGAAIAAYFSIAAALGFSSNSLAALAVAFVTLGAFCFIETSQSTKKPFVGG